MSDDPPSSSNDAKSEKAKELTRSYETMLRHEEKSSGEAAGDLTLTRSASEDSDAHRGTPTRSVSEASNAPPPAKRIIEALLFVGGNPLTHTGAADAIHGLTLEQFTEAVDSLNQDYRRQGRPYVVRLHDRGYSLELRSKYKPVWEKLYGSMREARLSTAAIDVLALVAYRQPTTKQEIESIRGAESGHLLRQLVRRRLIAVAHRGESSQRQVSYATTERFLELFGLKSLDDLPQTQDLQKL
jgi:segregation and condensation protein B